MAVIYKCVVEIANTHFVSIIGLKQDHLHQFHFFFHLFWRTHSLMHSVFLLWKNVEMPSRPSGLCHFKVTYKSASDGQCKQHSAMTATLSEPYPRGQRCNSRFIIIERQITRKQRFSRLMKPPHYIALAVVLFKHSSSFASAPHDLAKPDNAIWY